MRKFADGFGGFSAVVDEDGEGIGAFAPDVESELRYWLS